MSTSAQILMSEYLSYERFLKLLNDLSLVDKEYDLEASNLKFLLALPEKWDLKATTIIFNYELEDMSSDEICGKLKTHELEMEQRKKRHGGKSKSVALKAVEKASKEGTVVCCENESFKRKGSSNKIW